jgi:hypothetical protein
MIGGLRRVSYTAALVALTIVVLAGCNATGGGYIPSTIEGEKATFAFSAKCQNKTLKTETGEVVVAELKGQLQYNDHPADVKIHGVFFARTTGDSCEDFDTTDEDTDVFEGVYFVPGGPRREEDVGTVRLEVTDAGEPGINGDFVMISLFDGPHSGYTNSGFVQGGNVQVH